MSTDNTTNNHDDKTILIHKTGEEGGLEVFAHGDRAGMVKDPSEAPAWANGLAVARLPEHVQFYQKRVDGYALPDSLNADDLCWLAIDEDGQAMEIEANPETRSERLAELLGIDLNDIEAAHDRTTRDLVTAVVIDMDEVRTRKDADALLESQAEGAAAFKTGTDGA